MGFLRRIIEKLPIVLITMLEKTTPKMDSKDYQIIAD